MERRRFIEVIAYGLLAAPVAAEAKQAGAVARIGVLGDTSPPVETRGSGIAAFRHGLSDLGYVEGRNVTVEYLWAKGNREWLPDLATGRQGAPRPRRCAARWTCASGWNK
jgi:putative tryptophan/tyrosine transport system substrate-binding protein